MSKRQELPMALNFDPDTHYFLRFPKTDKYLHSKNGLFFDVQVGFNRAYLFNEKAIERFKESPFSDDFEIVKVSDVMPITNT
jgi:hypothetical protein